MEESSPYERGAWRWIPTLSFASGMPYFVVTDMAGDMFKLLGVGNTEITYYTGWLKFPYVIKPLWSPLVQGFGARRQWILITQFAIAAGVAAAAVALKADSFLAYSLLALAVVAISSATYDVAADGFYLLALSSHDQAWYVGIRNICYRLAMFTGKGILLIVAGFLAKRFGFQTAWTITLAMVAAAYALLAIFHIFALPRPAMDLPTAKAGARSFKNLLAPMISFFHKPSIGRILSFLVLYRLGEAQLMAMVGPFLLDSRSAGGLGLSAEEKGFYYGVVGVVALLAGGVLGGMLAARDGLKHWLWKMAIACHLPNIAFLLLAYFQPESHLLINLAIAIEQFGYGFGFTAYMLYCIYIARGESQTVHYAMCTGFMALGMMIPGMWSGWLQEQIGYVSFFAWIMASTIPSFLVVALIPLDAEFGKKQSE